MSRSTSPTIINYDSPRTLPKPEIIRKNPKSIKDDNNELNIESSPQLHASSGNSKQILNEHRDSLNSKNRKSSKKYSSTYGRKSNNEEEIPDIRVGYICKQCHIFSGTSIKRYFVLEKGILHNFKTEIDSHNKDIQESRKHKQINLKEYKLACDSLNFKLTLLAIDRSNKNQNNHCHKSRHSLILYCNNKEIYKSWEKSIKLHSIYAANQSINGNSCRFEELKLMSTILLNCDVETFMEFEKRGSGSSSNSERLSNSSNNSNKLMDPEETILSKKADLLLKSCKSTGRSSFMSIENSIVEGENEDEEI